MPEERERLLLHDFYSLTRQVPAPWVVRDILRDNSILLMYGQRGSYKSFLALDLACSIATGIPFLGHDIAKSGLVVYIAAEGSGGMVQRTRAWREAHPEIQRTIHVYFVTEPAIITGESEDMDLLIDRIRELIDWNPAGYMDEETGYDYDYETAIRWPVLIVIDTLARCFTGKENEQEDMGRFIQGVDRLRAAFQASVLVVHHSGRDASHERGSTVLPGAADTIFKVTDQGAGEIQLSCEKMKDSAEPPNQTVFYHQVTLLPTVRDTDDEPMTSVVLTTDTTYQGRKSLFVTIMTDPAYSSDQQRIEAMIVAGVVTVKRTAQKRILRYREALAQGLQHNQ